MSRPVQETPVCPGCGSLAATIEQCSSTLMAVLVFTDEIGTRHYDDPNTYTEERTCQACGSPYVFKYQRSRRSNQSTDWDPGLVVGI